MAKQRPSNALPSPPSTTSLRRSPRGRATANSAHGRRAPSPNKRGLNVHFSRSLISPGNETRGQPRRIVSARCAPPRCGVLRREGVDGGEIGAGDLDLGLGDVDRGNVGDLGEESLDANAQFLSEMEEEERRRRRGGKAAAGPMRDETEMPGAGRRSGGGDEGHGDDGDDGDDADGDGDVNMEKSEQEEQALDAHIHQSLTELWTDITTLTARHFSFAIPTPSPNHSNHPSPIATLLHPTTPPELISYAGRLAVGGASGLTSWEEILLSVTPRRALVGAIIWRALKAHVFDTLLFSTSANTSSNSLGARLRSLEKAGAEADGFARTCERADVINEYLRYPAIFEREKKHAVAALATGIAKVLAPIAALAAAPQGQGQGQRQGQPPQAPPTGPTMPLRTALCALIARAVDLHILMRRQRDVVYYFPPTFKDEEFDPARMVVVNRAQMQKASPFNTAAQRRANGIKRDRSRSGSREDLALVRVVCTLGCVAYRPGGGRAGRRAVEAERAIGGVEVRVPVGLRGKGGSGMEMGGSGRLARRRGRKERVWTGEEGFRTKVVAKSVVCLRWGGQRRFGGEGEGGKGGEDEGFRELRDLYDDARRMEGGEGERGCAVM